MRERRTDQRPLISGRALVRRNPQLIARKQKGRFFGHLSVVVVSDFRSLPETSSSGPFDASVSGGKNPAPNSTRKSALHLFFQSEARKPGSVVGVSSSICSNSSAISKASAAHDVRT